MFQHLLKAKIDMSNICTTQNITDFCSSNFYSTRTVALVCKNEFRM